MCLPSQLINLRPRHVERPVNLAEKNRQDSCWRRRESRGLLQAISVYLRYKKSDAMYQTRREF